MARMNFFEILSSDAFSATAEYETLLHLFGVEKSVYINRYAQPLIEYVDRAYFRELPFRGTYTSVKQMVSRLEQIHYHSSLERLFVFCEFLIAVLPAEHTKRDVQAYEQSRTIMQNIAAILDRTNHERRMLENSRVIIAEKNPHVTQAVELVEDGAIALGLLEYNHFALRGNLEEKRKILTSLGQYLEPILLSRKLEKNGYKQLDSDMGFLLNKFHIRHNNKEGQKAQEYIQKISDTELEEWYDKTYNTALAVIIADQQIDISAELGELKRTYTWKG